MTKDDRFQNQNILVKFWRLRHYLTVPFVAVRVYYYEHTRELEDADDWRMRFSDCWNLAKGLSQSKMKWYFTAEEMEQDFKVDGSVEDI